MVAPRGELSNHNYHTMTSKYTKPRFEGPRKPLSKAEEAGRHAKAIQPGVPLHMAAVTQV